MLERDTINKTIKINATKKRVWEVLLQDKYFCVWSSEFAPDTYADTDWEAGGRVEFKGRNESGLFGTVTMHEPNEVISIRYQGVLDSGTEDVESVEAQQWIGCAETYRVYEENGVCVLAIEHIIPKKYVNAFDDTWDGALDIIKELAERGDDYFEVPQHHWGNI